MKSTGTARLFGFFLAVLGAAQLGCTTGYTKSGGQWYCISINEAVGRKVVRTDADNDTFEVLADPDYAKDKNHVYQFGVPMWGLDASTFRMLSSPSWAVDRNGVYYKDNLVPGADPETFEALGCAYGRDLSSVFCGTVKMSVDNPKGFVETSSQTGAQMWSVAYRGEDLVKQLGDEFSGVRCDRDHPHYWRSNSSGTDGMAIYSGPLLVSRLE